MSTTGRIALVRHADALARARWDAPDDQRPLTRKGERHAEALTGPLLALGPSRALTSPARRCADTLAPLARAAGLTLEDEPLLAEGTAPKVALGVLLDGLRALEPPARTVLVACSHGDVVDGIVGLLAREGVPFEASGAVGAVVLQTPKGARWELDVEDGTVAAGCLVSPPDGTR